MGAEAVLLKLVPGFKCDRDEDWMIYLTPEKQTYMRTHRANYIAIEENLEKFQASFDKYLMDNRHIDNVNTRQAIAEFEHKRAKFLEKRNLNAKSLLLKIQELKNEAVEKRKKTRNYENEEFRKRRRLNHIETNVLDVDDVEFVPDDYLPNYATPQDDKDIVKPVPMVTDTSPPISPPPPHSGASTSNTQDQDPFIKDVDPMDAEILLELKSLIYKYNCRDRVLRAIQSFRSRDKSLKALEAFTMSMAMFKNEVSGSGSKGRKSNRV